MPATRSEATNRSVARSRYSETGAGTVEYLGVMAVVTVIIAGLVVLPWSAQFGTQVRDTIDDVICSISSNLLGGGDCAETHQPVADNPYQSPPPRCNVSSSSQHSGFEVNVPFVELGEGIVLDLAEYSDDEYHVTVMDQGLVAGNVSSGVQWGKGLSIGVHGDIGVGLDVRHGDTFVFDSADEAQDFVSEMEDYVTHGSNYVPCNGGICAGIKSYFNPEPEAPTDPQINRTEVDASFFASGRAGARASLDGEGTNSRGVPDDTLGPDDGTLPNVALNGSIGPNAVITTDQGSNPNDPSGAINSWTFGFDAEGAGNIGDESEELGGDVAITVDMNMDDELVGLHVNGSYLKGVNDEHSTDMVNVSIPVDAEEDSAAIQDWLEELARGEVDPRDLLPAEGEEWDPAEIAGEALDPLLQRAEITREVHSGTGSDDSMGARARLAGIGLGYNTVNDSGEEVLDEAYYMSNDSGSWGWEENTSCDTSGSANAGGGAGGGGGGGGGGGR